MEEIRRNIPIFDMRHDPADLPAVKDLEFIRLAGDLRVVGGHGVEGAQQHQRGVVEQPRHDGRAFDEPDLREGGFRARQVWRHEGQRVHGRRDTSHPFVAVGFQQVPRLPATVHLHIRLLALWLQELGRGRAEVGGLGQDVEDLVTPLLLVPAELLRLHGHVQIPRLRIPGHAPVEVETGEKFQTDVEPEAGAADAGGGGVPATFFDEGAGAGDVVHSSQCGFGHDLVDVEDCCRGGAEDGVAVGIL